MKSNSCAEQDWSKTGFFNNRKGETLGVSFYLASYDCKDNNVPCNGETRPVESQKTEIS